MRKSLLAVLAGVAMLSVSPVHAGQILITEQEATLPPPKGAVAVATRGITRGPKIDPVSKLDGVKSPIRLQLKFESFGGATIDTKSLKVTYLKSPSVDLTSRVQPFIQPTGIDMPDATLPPGEHQLRVDVKDSDGRTATANVVLKIVP